MYSAMSHTWKVDKGDVQLTHFSPFWAVMLAGRDTKNMVNMIPHNEEYKLPHPIPKKMGEVRHQSTVTLTMPFLTNKIELKDGDLLVLPFDGDIAEIFCESFPALHAADAN